MLDFVDIKEGVRYNKITRAHSRKEAVLEAGRRTDHQKQPVMRKENHGEISYSRYPENRQDHPSCG